MRDTQLADPYIGRILEKKYELVRMLGRGGMGVVYEAKHRLINRRLAIKLLHAEYAHDPGVAERFRREAQAASAIGHDHIVDVTDMGFTESGELYIVMEYLDGIDLATCLADGKRLDPERACHITIQVLSALEAAHSKGIIHRDLKPANIFLVCNRDAEDYVKLVDFGISKIKEEDSEHEGLTRTGELLGTPSYMSPEQARGETNITHHTDIFSVGLILYRILTGKTAFEEKALTMLLLKIIGETPPSPCELVPSIPPALSDAVMQAIEKNPGKRFADAASFRRAINQFSPNTACQTGLGVTRFRDSALSSSFDLQTGNYQTDNTSLQLTETISKPKQNRGFGVIIAALTIAAMILAVAAYQLLVQNNQSDKKETPLIPLVTTLPAETGVVNERIPSSIDNTNAVDENSRDTKTENEKATLSFANQTVALEIDVSPPSAQVSIDGVLNPRGSINLHVPRDQENHSIEVTAPGFQTFRQEMKFDRNIKLVVNLLPDNKSKSSSSANPTKSSESSHTDKAGHKPSVSDTGSGKDSKSDAAATDGRLIRIIDEIHPW